jgi:membrane-bound lytic murein transglycosylase A
MNPLLWRFARSVAALWIVGTLWGCATAPQRGPEAGGATGAVAPPGAVHGDSRWVPAQWADLPGFADDSLFEAWNAWIKSCQRPGRVFAPLCDDVRRLSIASPEERRAWMMQRLQPYRVEPLSGSGADGLLTGYYEPLFDASRVRRPGFEVPLYGPPAGLRAGRPWYTREQIDTSPEAQAALRGHEIAWLADPIDALILQIQGSGRLRVAEPDGTAQLVRLSFAGTNDQPYRSVGRWLLDQGATRDATWPGIRAWLAKNPQRTRELLWSNPRVVFFREEPLPAFDAAFGPRGAQGVALTPGRSIAVDAASIPYGTPVWLASNGPLLKLERLVLAQDTGSAIVGAVRADYFTGSGAQAGELAGRLKQPLRLWVLWPKQAEAR